jgi:hypothetical protein
MSQQTNTKVGFFGAVIEFRKWVVLLLIALVLFFGYNFFKSRNHESTIEYNTNLIEKQIKNVMFHHGLMFRKRFKICQLLMVYHSIKTTREKPILRHEPL